MGSNNSKDETYPSETNRVGTKRKIEETHDYNNDAPAKKMAKVSDNESDKSPSECPQEACPRTNTTKNETAKAKPKNTKPSKNLVLTFDTNADHIITLIKSKLAKNTVAWCSAKNNCSNSANDQSLIYCNTPLKYNYQIPEKLNKENRYVHFVYLDFNIQNQALTDLLQSTSETPNDVILLTNLLPEQTTVKNPETPIMSLENVMYRIVTNNCSDKIISESIAIIINGAIVNGRTLHPENLISLSCKNININIMDVDWNMIFNIHKLIRSKYMYIKVDDDCVECKI